MTKIYSFQGLTKVGTAAAAHHVVPGLVVAVGSPALAGGVYNVCLGLRGEGEGPTNSATSYDLASLTKALCTSVLAMQAVGEGRLNLQDPLIRWMPGAPAGITIEHTLTHTTGWPAHRKFYEELLPNAAGHSLPNSSFAEAIVERAAATPPLTSPGGRAVYSDLGFIVLGKILELVFEQTLDEAFANRIAMRIGQPELRFKPTTGPFAPTEVCGWRGKLLCGQVHDQNAWLMGGVAGHAGLFGSADAVAALVSSLLRTYSGGAGELVEPDILAQFWNHRAGSGTWALGWDRPSNGFSLAGQKIARTAVGHLGFTGCSLWLDPRALVFVVMLSNRIHPHVVEDERFRALRPAIMDAALEDLGYTRG